MAAAPRIVHVHLCPASPTAERSRADLSRSARRPTAPARGVTLSPRVQNPSRRQNSKWRLHVASIACPEGVKPGVSPRTR